MTTKILYLHFFCAITQLSHAATGTWSGPSNGTWSTSSTNWSGVSGTPWNATNGPNNIAIFNQSGLNATISGTVFASGITFNTSGFLGGGPISITGGTTTTATIANGQTATIRSLLTGTGSLTKSGTGRMVLFGLNTYSGNTTVSGGVLSLSIGEIYSDLLFRSRLITISGGAAVEIGGWGDNAAAGLGQNDFLSGNILLNNGRIIYTGGYEGGHLDRGFTISSGGAILEAAGGASSFNLTHGRNFGIASNSGGTLTLTGASNGVFGHNLGGSGAVVKSGSGAWTMSGKNTYTGNTTVSGGILSLATGQIYQNLGYTDKLLSVNSGSTVEIGGWGDAATAGIGQLGFGGSNVLLDGGRIRYLGGFDGGNMDRGFSIGASGATLTADGLFNPFILLQGRGWGVVSNSGGSLTLNGSYTGEFGHNLSGSGGLVKSGIGKWTLTGINTYSGNTTVTAGILSLSTGKIYHNLGWASKLINISGKAVVEVGGWGDNATSGFGQIDLRSNNVLIDDGTIRYTGMNDAGNMDRGFTIGSGGATLEAEGGPRDFILNTGRGYGISNTSGGNLTLTGSFNGTFDHSLGGSGGLMKLGSGTWRLPNIYTYSGNTIVKGGVLSLAVGRIYSNLGFASRLVSIDGGGVIEIGGWGDFSRAGFGQNDFKSGNLVINDGTIRYIGGQESGGIDRGFTIGALGATLEATGGVNSFNTLHGRGYGIVSNERGDLTLSGSSNGSFGNNLGGAGGLVKSGTGTWALSGNNTYTGDTIINAGNLAVNGSSIPDTGKLVINGGSLNLSGTETVKTMFFGSTQMPRGTYAANGIQLKGSGSLIVLSDSTNPYISWAKNVLSSNDVPNPSGDRDNDGVSNWAEFAFGLNPSSAISNNPILIPLDVSAGKFTYQRRAESGLKYKIFTSTTLTKGSWTHDVTAKQIAGAVDSNGNQAVQVTLTTAPFEVKTRNFIRVVAESDWQMGAGGASPIGDNSSGFSYSSNSFLSYSDQVSFDYGFSARFTKPDANESVYIGMTTNKPEDGDTLHMDMTSSSGANTGFGIILTPKGNGVTIQMRIGGQTLPLTNIPYIDNFDWTVDHVYSFEQIPGKTNLQFCIDGVPCDPELDAGASRMPLVGSDYQGYLTLGGVNGDLVVDKLRFITAVFDVRNNGAIGDGLTDDGSAINKTIFDATTYITANPQGNAVVKFGKNTTYKMDDMGVFSADSRYAFTVNNTKNITLLGDNTTIDLAPRHRYLAINDSSNIKVKGFNFDLTTKASVRAKIVALNPALGTVDMESPIEFDFPGNTYTANEETFCRPDDGGRGHTFITRYERLSQPRIYRIHLQAGSQNYRFLNNIISVGEYYYLPSPGVGFTTESQNAFSFWRNGDVQIDDCNIWSVPFFCFDIKFNVGNISFTNVNIRPEVDNTPEYGENVSWRDGFHCKENLGKFAFTNCEFRGLNDDAINLCSTYLYVREVTSPARFTMSCEGYGGQFPVAKPGDEISIINRTTGAFIANTKIKKVYASRGAIHDIEVEASIPVDILRAPGVTVMAYYGSAPGSVIKNCKINGTLRFRSPIVFENTTFELLYMWIQNDEFNEGPIPKNMLFKNCSIVDHRSTGRPIVSVSTDMYNTNLTPQYKCENIVFENCIYSHPREQLFKIAPGNKVIFR